MKIIKTILEIILITIVSICAFGGGCIIWTFLAMFIQPEPKIMEIMFYITMFVPMPFCWYIAPKLGEKIL